MKRKPTHNETKVRDFIAKMKAVKQREKRTNTSAAWLGILAEDEPENAPGRT